MRYNYSSYIIALFDYRGRLRDLKTSNNKTLIEYFENSTYDSFNENASQPKINEIAGAIGIELTKLRATLKELYFSLLESLYKKPIEITRSLISIYICIPWDEERKVGQKVKADQPDPMLLSVDITLHYIPRLGEEIQFNTLDYTTRYTHGYVNKISHEIRGEEQRIVLWVHPFKNYYHEWEKQKKKYNDRGF